MQLVGIQRGISSKTSKPYTIMHVVGNFNDDDTSRGALGFQAQSIFYNNALDASPRDEIEIVWEPGYNNQIRIKDVKVIKKAQA